MRAIWNGATLAQADKKDLIYIEGNWYFPPESIVTEHFQHSHTTTHCPWKGDASYYHISVNDEINPDAAWYYPQPLPGGIERVKKDFTDYVAFWHGVEIGE